MKARYEATRNGVLTWTAVAMLAACTELNRPRTGNSNPSVSVDPGICEATPPAKCYYIDPVNGNDLNDSGKFATPWRSFRNIITYYPNHQYEPAKWVDINPGDYIYLRAGTHNTVVTPGDDGGASGGAKAIAYFRGEIGDPTAWYHITAYPGETVVVDAGSQGSGIYVLQGGYWDISGFTIQHAFASEGGGITDAENTGMKIHDMRIIDNGGPGNDNASGYHMAWSKDVEIYNSYFANNYDRNASDGVHWGQHAIFFDGGSVDVHDNTFEQTTGRGACVFYKHAALGSADHFYVYRNSFNNCTGVGLGSGTQNTWFHHNIVSNGEGIMSEDFGGTTHQNDQLFEFNTLYNTSGFYMDPTDQYGNPSNITWRNNIIYDTRTTFNSDNATVNIGPYRSDALYDITVPQLHFSGNCYHDSNPPVVPEFGLFSAGGSYGAKGGLYDIAGWRGLGFDVDAVVANPEFVNPAGGDFHTSANSPCAGMGAYAGTR